MPVTFTLDLTIQMSARLLSFSDRIVAALLGAVFGCAIGLVVAWLLMFSSTLYLWGIGSHPVSFLKSAAAGAVFFAAAGAVLGSSAGTLVGCVLAALIEFERLDQKRVPWTVELVLILAGMGVVLWVNGVFAT